MQITRREAARDEPIGSLVLYYKGIHRNVSVFIFAKMRYIMIKRIDYKGGIAI